jgi:hypothetical protein
MRTREALKQAIDSLDPVPLHVVLWDEGWQKPTVVPRHDFVTEYWPVGQPSAKQDPSFYDPSLNASVPLVYGNHNYRLDCIPTHEMVADGYSSTPTLIAAGAAVLVGVCMLMLICGWLILNVRRSNSRAALLIEANAGKNLALELLAEAKELADRANKSKSDFLAFLCHELRNPVSQFSRPFISLLNTCSTAGAFECFLLTLFLVLFASCQFFFLLSFSSCTRFLVRFPHMLHAHCNRRRVVQPSLSLLIFVLPVFFLLLFCDLCSHGRIPAQRLFPSSRPRSIHAESGGRTGS